MADMQGLPFLEQLLTLNIQWMLEAIGRKGWPHHGKAQGPREKSYFPDVKSDYETHVRTLCAKTFGKTPTHVPKSYARSELNCRLFELQTTQTSCGGFKKIWIDSPQMTTGYWLDRAYVQGVMLVFGRITHPKDSRQKDQYNLVLVDVCRWKRT